MNNRDGGNTDRVLRTAIWFYLTPKVVTVAFVVSAVVLAALLVLIPATEVLLQSLAR